MATFEDDVRLQVQAVNDATTKVNVLKADIANCKNLQATFEAKLVMAERHRDIVFSILNDLLFPPTECPHCDGSLNG